VLIGGIGPHDFHYGKGFDIILDYDDKFEVDTQSKL
jgi:hypothetical protein